MFNESAPSASKPLFTSAMVIEKPADEPRGRRDWPFPENAPADMRAAQCIRVGFVQFAPQGHKPGEVIPVIMRA